MVELKKILAPVDIDDEGSDKVLEYAISMAKAFDSELVLMHAVSLSPYFGVVDEAASDETVDSAIKDIFKNAEEDMAAFLRDERLKGLKVSSIVVGGDPAEEILNALADTRADFLVMGINGCKGLGCYIFGSVAHKILQTSPVPVTLVHPE